MVRRFCFGRWPVSDRLEDASRFLERLEAAGVSLPHFVKEEFEAYLKFGRLEYGFLRVKCDACRHEKLVAFSCKRRGCCFSCPSSRALFRALRHQTLRPDRR